MSILILLMIGSLDVNDPAVYVVEPGDCLWFIARDHGWHGTIEQLAEWNDIENPDLIYPGQRIRLANFDSGTTTNSEMFESGVSYSWSYDEYGNTVRNEVH